MNAAVTLLLAFCIGVVAGLRTFTAPAVTAWAARLGWIDLSASPLPFMGSSLAVGIFTLLAVLELLIDQLPQTPARTTAAPLTGRVIMGVLTGMCITIAGGGSFWLGAFLGAVGAVAGAFGGYRARVGLVRDLHVPDFAIAIPEDLIAIGLGLVIVSRF